MAENMEKKLEIFANGVVIGIVLMIIAFLVYLGWHRERENGSDEPVKSDTVYIYDTTFVDTPVVVRETFIKYIKVPADTADKDTIGKDTMGIKIDNDSVIIPITQKEYTDDSTYKAWVSGYMPQLDSFQTYQKKIIIINTIQKKKKWSWGLQGGVYITPKGIQPGAGFGVQYRF